MCLLPVTMTYWDYDQVLALADGRVRIEGCDSIHFDLDIHDIFFRAIRHQEFDITEIVYNACHTLVPPTVEALQDLIATYDPEFQAKMRSNILLGGGGSQITGLGRAIEEALDEYGGGRVKTVEEPQYAGSNGALKIALDLPEEYWKQFSPSDSAASNA